MLQLIQKGLWDTHEICSTVGPGENVWPNISYVFLVHGIYWKDGGGYEIDLFSKISILKKSGEERREGDY